MKYKEFLEEILFLVSVPTCVGCGERLDYKEKVYCNRCKPIYNEQKARTCSRCKNSLDSCSCATFYLEKHNVKSLTKLFRYFKEEDNLVANNLIYSLKHDYRADVIDYTACEIIGCLDRCGFLKNTSNTVITNVPRRKSSIRKYGYDHTRLLAKRIAKQLEIEFVCPIVSLAKKEQKRAKSREERLKNVRFDYKKNVADLSGKTVILVDDVVTTGASMGSVAMLLRGLGAKKIVGASLSIAYKDSYIPFEESKNK